jgi:hypothetical protein
MNGEPESYAGPGLVYKVKMNKEPESYSLQGENERGARELMS